MSDNMPRKHELVARTQPVAAVPPLAWEAIAPRFAALQRQVLTAADMPAWLAAWSDAQKLVLEARVALHWARIRHLDDPALPQASRHFDEQIMAPFTRANQTVTAKALAVTDWRPTPEQREFVRQWRSAARLAHDENVAIAVEVSTLVREYERLAAKLTIPPAGQLLRPDRAIREAAWRAWRAPWLRDRARLDRLFLELLARRRQLARNVGLPDYRAYRWHELARLGYSPAECRGFHDAIAAEIVPLAARRQAAKAAALGVATLHPWDEFVDPAARPPLSAYADLPAFEQGMAGVCAALDPEVGALYADMRGRTLDLGWRAGKRGGGEAGFFPLTRRPFVLVGVDGDEEGVGTLLHEMGHALHNALANGAQPLIWQGNAPDEAAEFAVMTFSYLALPLLGQDRGGPYSREEMARFRASYLTEEGLAEFALADAFQHWVYGEAPADVQPADLDAKWAELSAHFAPWWDWSGVEEYRAAAWHRCWSLFQQPFYEIAYPLATLGALQVWQRAQTVPAAAWRDYRAALALGNTRPLAELFAAAGARLPLDRGNRAKMRAGGYRPCRISPVFTAHLRIRRRGGAGRGT